MRTRKGRTIALYSDTGGGKTTQLGEIAKDQFKSDRLKMVLVQPDLGGAGSIQHIIRKGIISQLIPPISNPTFDPWTWMNDLAVGKGLPLEEIGAIAFDSGTSMGEMLLNFITKDLKQYGQQKTQRFTVSSGLSVGANNESHYGLVQNFLLDIIWRSTWLTEKGVDVIWTFGLDRSEKQDSTPVLGPKLAGHALTSSIPKWFNFTFRLVSIPVAGQPARHVLYLQEQPDMNGMGMSFGNSRYPLGVTDLPAIIEPASVVEAIRLIDLGVEEADRALDLEMGL